MRETQWAPARGGAGLLIDRPRLTARRPAGLGQSLISGDLDAAIAELAPGAPMLGLYALAPEGAHALRIGRFSALLVTLAPLIGRLEERPSFDGLVVDGWRDGWCATSVDDGWAAVEVSGTHAPPALMQAASADLASGSPSAAILFFGLRGLLVRTPLGFRVHIEAPWLETLLGWLDGV
jgi:sarcosine oxidase, subunit gamma